MNCRNTGRIAIALLCMAVLGGCVANNNIVSDTKISQIEQTLQSQEMENTLTSKETIVYDYAKMVLKISVDIAMTVVLLLLMAYELIGRAAHEWIGISMLILFILHHALNDKWIRNILKGRYTVVRMLQTILAIAILLCMMGSMISGIILSRHVFTFLSIRGGQSWARTMHLLSSYWGFVLMNLHLGVHWSMMIGMIKKYLGALSPKQTWLLRAVAVAIAIYGVFAFAHREIGGYLFLKNEFVFFNFEEPLILFFLDYIAVMGFFVFVGYYFTIFLKWYGRKKAI